MKYLFGIIIFCGAIHLNAQTGNATANNVIPDTIVKFGGVKIPVFIRNIQQIFVYYSLVAKPNETVKIERKDVEKVIFKNGRVEVFNNSAFTVIDEGRWETVLVTRNKNDIEGLYKRREVSSVSSPQRTKKKAKENAYIKLQKQAANAGGTIVLIIEESFFGGYGDNPGYTMKGIAYGTEPLEEGTNVVEDPAKKSTPSNQKQGQNKPQTGTQQKSTTTQPQKK